MCWPYCADLSSEHEPGLICGQVCLWMLLTGRGHKHSLRKICEKTIDDPIILDYIIKLLNDPNSSRAARLNPLSRAWLKGWPGTPTDVLKSTAQDLGARTCHYATPGQIRTAARRVAALFSWIYRKLLQSSSRDTYPLQTRRAKDVRISRAQASDLLKNHSPFIAFVSPCKLYGGCARRDPYGHAVLVLELREDDNTVSFHDPDMRYGGPCKLMKMDAFLDAWENYGFLALRV